MEHSTGKRKKLNVADWISVYRIGTAPLLLLVSFAGMKVLFVILLALGLFSDMLDGYVARRLNCCTTRGARLDSVGDALTFLAALAGVFVFEQKFLLENVPLLLLAMIPYFAQIIYAVIRYGKPTSFHTYLAKTAALLQGCFILLLLLWEPLYWFFYLTVIVTVLEVVEEFLLLFFIGGEATNVKGLYWVLKKQNTKKQGGNVQ